MADEEKSYDIVLRETDTWTELARLENALNVTVSDEKVEYDAVFTAENVTATWKSTPGGIGYIHSVEDESCGGGTPISPVVIVNYAFKGDEVLDLRVVKTASLEDQMLSVTITSASETTYQAESGEPEEGL